MVNLKNLEPICKNNIREQQYTNPIEKHFHSHYQHCFLKQLKKTNPKHYVYSLPVVGLPISLDLRKNNPVTIQVFTYSHLLIVLQVHNCNKIRFTFFKFHYCIKQFSL